jgi:hypothetical protein
VQYGRIHTDTRSSETGHSDEKDIGSSLEVFWKDYVGGDIQTNCRGDDQDWVLNFGNPYLLQRRRRLEWSISATTLRVTIRRIYIYSSSDDTETIISQLN